MVIPTMPMAIGIDSRRGQADEVCGGGVVADRADARAGRAAVEEGVQSSDQGDGEQEDQQRIDADRDRPDVEGRKFDRAAGELAGVGAVSLQEAVLDDDRQTKGHEEDRQDALADGPLQEEALQDIARAKGDREEDERDQEGRPPENAGQRQDDEGEQHDHVAVGDVDEAHDAERQRQAEREQRVEAADQHTLDKEVEERLDHSAHAPK